MTDEIPKQRRDVLRCSECNQRVTVHRRDDNTLAVTCDCDEMRSIKVATVLPEGWLP